MNNNAFAACHPGITFLFFIAAIIFGMCFLHPVFLAVSCVLSAACLITIRRRRALKTIAVLTAVFVVIAVLNPIFNANGQQVLFVMPWGNNYCLEALCYGIAIGAVFVTVMLWFASYNTVMTSDKFIFLFGRAIPSLSLVLTMILRLVPSFRKKADQIAGARKCIGKGGMSGTRAESVQNGMSIVSSLTVWALEGGIITADSMQSRGYGSGNRTSFSVYRFDGRSKTLLAVLTVLIAIVLFCGIKGGMKTTYVPAMDITGPDDPYMLTGIIAYIILLAVPTVLNIMEAFKWHSLRSKI